MTDRQFSIIIPIYNRENNLAYTLGSVLCQSYKNWELLLVNDGSTDNSEAICKDFELKDSRVRYYYCENSGPCVARNIGIKHASGEYLLFLDCDDALKENALEILFKEISRNPKSDIICFGTKYKASIWRPTDSNKPVYADRADIVDKYLPALLNVKKNKNYYLTVYVWNKCYRTSFLKDNGISFDEKRRNYEDGLFTVICLKNADSLTLINTVLYEGDSGRSDKHISSDFSKDRIELYLKDEQLYYDLFSSVYDFKNEYYLRSNFNNLQDFFARAYTTFGEKAKSIIVSALEHKIIEKWVTNIQPETPIERRFVKLYAKGDYGRICNLYSDAMLYRIYRKIIMKFL